MHVALIPTRVKRNGYELLGHAGMSIGRMTPAFPTLASIDPYIAERIRIEALYAPLLERQHSAICAYRKEEAMHLPADLDYHAMPWLSTEATERLEKVGACTSVRNLLGVLAFHASRTFYRL